MKLYNLILFFILIICNIFYAQPDLWHDISESGITLVGKRYIIPDSYRTVELNLKQVSSLLKSAPIEYTPEAISGKTTINLPMPDGTNQRFKFWESPTMEPELQAKFPEIRTYTGQGIDDPYASLKFDLTPEGFHAQILSPNGRVFIDPHNQGDIIHYISYYSRDFHNKDGEFQCQLLIDEYQTPEPENFVTSPLPPTGPQLRTYRLANAATGEYTAFHGGTVALGLAAVTTSVNRVNGVYEKEVAVRMILVANNNLIIYTNPNTDPYTNNDGGAMLSQNISNLNSVIGSANYDIGHVFSTGGGGVAYLGCVCTSSKAGGVTGSPTPIGDPFDIDYVAHEMGHQFGGNHSFNGNEGSCSGGNRNASTAYEPGSGSTIMAYAGICGTQDLQAHSDAYFHVISFDEIRVYTNSGSGNGCAVITNTGNSAPVVTVPSGGFYIPKSTPFSLTGSANDPNSDPITYCWEEFDLGPAGHPNSPSGNAPIFRSFSPVTSSTRTFPKLSDLLNNTQTIGEILPTYTRNLTFRLTARDNRAGGGGVDYAQMSTFYVDGNSGPFVVTSPNTNVSWPGNSNQTITWNVANTSSSPVNCSNVKILLSTNGGNNFNTVLLASTPNDGSELVTVPNLPTSQARIKVEAVGNIFFDISNVNFNITNNPNINDPTNVTATPISNTQINVSFTPDAANDNVVIVWNLTGTFTTPTGTPPAAGQPFAGGTLLYNGTVSPASHLDLIPLTTYYYKLFSYDGSNYSPGVTVNATTLDYRQAAVDFAIKVDDNAGLTSNINFGLDLTATDGIDEALGEAELPGLPPGGYFAAWLLPDYTTMSYNDYRAPGNPPAFPFTGHKSHIIRIQTDVPAGNPMTISWNLPSTIAATSTIGVTGNLVSFSGTGSHTWNYNPVSLAYIFIEIDYIGIDSVETFELNVLVQNGWNMVSAPGFNQDGMEVGTWWSHKTGTVWGFNGTQYVAKTVATPGEGYWMKNTLAETYSYPALQIIPHNPIPVTLGWNMIGGYEMSPTIVALKAANPQITGTVWGFNGTQYVAATNLVPGYSYWAKVTSAGTITIPDAMAKGNGEVAEYFKEDLPDGKAGWGKIILTDATGLNYTLYAVKGDSPEGGAGVDLDQYELPPLPPAGAFDIRFSSGRIAEDINSSVKTIDMTGVTYPLTVRAENVDIRLMDETGKLINLNLKKGEDVVISDATIQKLMVSGELIPDKYLLEQNYPNPFNPSTVIEFSLPENVSNVKLTIYNALGEKVAELVNTSLVAGKYSYTWNASNVATGMSTRGGYASGVYIYELRTDKFVSVKKMILLR
jgi:hypothetical protein